MKIGIMQPYLFPYLGYFQLIKQVDKFVIYDDVSFIKSGWIHRNQILLNGGAKLFSVPLNKASSNRLIWETNVSQIEFQRWKNKFLKTIVLAYKKAPFFEATFELIKEVLETPPSSISALSVSGIQKVCEVLGIDTEIVTTSRVYENGHLHSQERVLNICTKEGAEIYINATGGRELYVHDEFEKLGMGLRFLRSRLPEYTQFENDFVSGLSILDVLMFNSHEKTGGFLRSFDLEK